MNNYIKSLNQQLNQYQGNEIPLVVHNTVLKQLM